MVETINNLDITPHTPKLPNGTAKPTEYQAPFNFANVLSDSGREYLVSKGIGINLTPDYQQLQITPPLGFVAFLNGEYKQILPPVTRATQKISIGTQSPDGSISLILDTQSGKQEMAFLSPDKQREYNQIQQMQNTIQPVLNSVGLNKNSIVLSGVNPCLKVTTQGTQYENMGSTYTQLDRSGKPISSTPSKALIIDGNSRVNAQAIPGGIQITVDDVRTGVRVIWQTNSIGGINQNPQQQPSLDTRPRDPKLSLGGLGEAIIASGNDRMNMIQNFDALVGKWGSLSPKDQQYFLDTVIGPRMTINGGKIIAATPSLDGKSLLVDAVPMNDVIGRTPPRRFLINKFNYGTF